MKNRDARHEIKINEDKKQETFSEFTDVFRPLCGYGWVTMAMEMIEREKQAGSTGICDAQH